MKYSLSIKHAIMSILLMIAILAAFMPLENTYAASKTGFEYGNIKIAVKTKYQVKLLDKNGKLIPASDVTWKTADKSIAKINKKGMLSGVKKGKTKVIAKYKGKTYKTTVRVYKFDIKKLKKSFGIPSKVKVKVKKEEVYYWWEAQAWMVPVQISLTDGTPIASADCEVTSPDIMKNIWVNKN